MKRIEIVVTPEGETSIETKGYSGDACRWAGAFLESALGQKLTEKPTREAYANAPIDHVVRTS